MLSLEAHHIVDLFVWVDDHLPKQTHAHGGRPSLLQDSELVTLLIWNAIVLHQKTMKDIHTFTRLHLASEFPFQGNRPRVCFFADYPAARILACWLLGNG